MRPSLGLSDSEFQFLVENLVRRFSALGAKVYAFGSRARGEHSRFSDLDIMVVPSDDQVTPELSAKLSLVQECFEESNFPYKLDLVALPQFASEYRGEYERDRIELMPRVPGVC